MSSCQRRPTTRYLIGRTNKPINQFGWLVRMQELAVLYPISFAIGALIIKEDTAQAHTVQSRLVFTVSNARYSFL